MRARSFLSILLLLSVILITCSEDKPTDPVDPVDTTAPLTIADLAIIGEIDTSATITWTAPADDPADGVVNSYDIRYATDSLVLTGWSEATAVTVPPTPAEPGETEQLEISGLAYNSVYYFGVKSADTAENVSELSNIISQSHGEMPQVIITYPAMDEGVADLVDITVLARDDQGVEHVAFYVDAEMLNVDYDAPYTYQWDAHLESHGTIHTIVAKATDADNHLTVSDTLRVNIDRLAAAPPDSDILAMDQSDSGVVMTWAACLANDFDHYEIRWDTLSIIIALRNSEQVTERFDTTMFIELEFDYQNYYFTVNAFDQFNNFSRTDTSITTGDKLPPPVELSHLIKITDTTARVIWIASGISDFDEYNLYRSTDAIFDAFDLLVYTTTNMYDTTFVDNLLADTDEYYFVQISDLSDHTDFSQPFSTNQLEIIGSEWALKLDGLNDFMEIPSRQDWYGLSYRTIEMWVYPDPPHEWQNNHIAISAGEHEWELDITSLANSYYNSGGCHVEVSNTLIPVKTWTHIAIASNWNENYLKFFINGELVDSLTCRGLFTFALPLIVGARPPDNFYSFGGMVDEIRIWTICRTNQEIQDNYNVAITNIPEGLIGYWPLEEGYGSQTWMGVGPNATLGEKNDEDKSTPVWVRITR